MTALIAIDPVIAVVVAIGFSANSSVYGANTSMPFSVHDNLDHPLGLYAVLML